MKRSKTEVTTDQFRIEEVLTRGVEEVIELDDLRAKLKSGKQLRIKLGIDPTSPNLHLGRAIPLLKLKDFQDLGHQIVLIIGDFTGIIGDTSDKESERPMLSEETVKKNLETYVEQAKKILDIDKCEIRYNSEWLTKLDYKEIGKQADQFSLNNFISRENISKRLDEGKRISVRELLYPMMQGYDSVAVKADVEIGGTDQKFNLLAGRDLQRFYTQDPQNILTNPLIEGLDGRKMSSSWGNTVNLLDSAGDMFGKIMSLRDELIYRYFVWTTRVSYSELENIKKDLESDINPRDIKFKLATEIVKMYHGEEEAKEAGENFDSIFSKGEFPSDARVIKVGSDTKLIDVIVNEGVIGSKTEARRLFENGAVHDFPDKKIINPTEMVGIEERKIKIGKKIFIILKPKAA